MARSIKRHACRQRKSQHEEMNMKNACRIAIGFVLAFYTLLAANPARAQFDDPSPGSQVEQSDGGEGLHYLLYLPNGYNQTKSWPIILFLHGTGGSGSNISNVQNEALPSLLTYNSFSSLDILKNNFILISPQCPSNMDWLSQMNKVLSIVDTVTRIYRGDSSRTYIVGVSMGGAGAWYYAARAPGRWAAMVVLAGGLAPHGGPTLAQLGSIGEALPIWVQHGDDDTGMPYSDSVNAVRLLQNSG